MAFDTYYILHIPQCANLLQAIYCYVPRFRTVTMIRDLELLLMGAPIIYNALPRGELFLKWFLPATRAARLQAVHNSKGRFPYPRIRGGGWFLPVAIGFSRVGVLAGKEVFISIELLSNLIIVANYFLQWLFLRTISVSGYFGTNALRIYSLVILNFITF